MKKGQILEGIVERVDFPNKGIVKVKEEDGKESVCVVKNVLPGQTLSFRVQKKRNGKAEGQLLELLKRAENEVESPCPHFGRCGGCLYHTLSYEAQCKLKEEQVKRLLRGVLGEEGAWQLEAVRQSPAVYGYRNKMEFTFGDEVKDGPLSLGLHKRGGFYDIVTVSDCQIMDGDYRRILTAVRDYFEKNGFPFFHRLRHTGFLRHLLVRKGAKTGEILVALVTTGGIDSVTGNDSPEEEKKTLEKSREIFSPDSFVKMLLELPLQGKITGILHIINDSVADVVKSDEIKLLYGRDYFYEELLGLRFLVTAFSFFQTNSLGAEVLYSTVRELIGDLSGNGEKADKVVFDLYSGTGTIAQLMAPMAKKVVGVEIVEEAVTAARENATLNGLHNCEFIVGDVLKVLDELEEKPDLIILDPPREGVHPKALKKILDYGVERMIYVSCKPTSLARDLVSFLEAGYKVERVVAVDQFPWTGNVETCVLLSRKKAGNNSIRIRMVDNEILMPINEQFIEVFEVFMDGNQRTKIRANNVRQYTEGIVDLILKDKIVPALKPNEKYEGINWGRKIKILQENYDIQIANNIQEIFKIGGEGSHFNGEVKQDELQIIINNAIHIVEDIFVKYFLEPEHKFGSENIFTIFSMLPLKHRIYILENVSKYYMNSDIVDRLSLAYAKNGEKNKMLGLLKKSLKGGIIDKEYYDAKLMSINVLVKNLAELYKRNAEYKQGQKYSKAIISNGLIVIGMPTSKDIFDTAEAVQMFKDWFERDKGKYPEFINLFLYLMQTDNRKYK